MKKLSLLPALLFVFIVTHAQIPVAKWGRGIDSATLGSSPGIATDAAGNVYVGGSFGSASFVFGNSTLPNNATNGANNMFLAKFDSSGNSLWAKTAGGGANEGTEAVTETSLGADANGNVYVIGSYTTDSAIFDNVTLTGIFNGSSFLVKYDAQGNAQWAVNVGQSLTSAASIAVDAQGNSYITGAFTSSYIVAGNDTLPLAANIGGFTIKYDSAGNSIWGATISGNNIFNSSITVDAEGNTYITGSYNGTSITFSNSISLTNTVGYGMFTARYNKNGIVQWAKNVSLSSAVTPVSITADTLGNIYIAGNTSADTLIFGTDTAFTFSTSATSNIFVVAYDSSGNTKWLNCTTNTNNINAAGASAAAGGQLFVTGSFLTTSVNIGNTVLVNNDTALGLPLQAMYIAEYNSAGNLLWVGGGLPANNDADAGVSVLADNKGHVYQAGIYAGPSVIFANDTLPPFGTATTPANVFVAKYSAPQGTVGISEPANAKNILVYPNPSTGTYFFKGAVTGSHIQIYNLLGQHVCSAAVNTDTFILNLQGQAKGVYLYRVTTPNGQVNEGKIVLE